jgi:hypothetical protein
MVQELEEYSDIIKRLEEEVRFYKVIELALPNLEYVSVRCRRNYRP